MILATLIYSVYSNHVIKGELKRQYQQNVDLRHQVAEQDLNIDWLMDESVDAFFRIEELEDALNMQP